MNAKHVRVLVDAAWGETETVLCTLKHFLQVQVLVLVPAAVPLLVQAWMVLVAGVPAGIWRLQWPTVKTSSLQVK